MFRRGGWREEEAKAKATFFSSGGSRLVGQSGQGGGGSLIFGLSWKSPDAFEGAEFVSGDDYFDKRCLIALDGVDGGMRVRAPCCD